MSALVASDPLTRLQPDKIDRGKLRGAFSNVVKGPDAIDFEQIVDDIHEITLSNEIVSNSVEAARNVYPSMNLVDHLQLAGLLKEVETIHHETLSVDSKLGSFGNETSYVQSVLESSFKTAADSVMREFIALSQLIEELHKTGGQFDSSLVKRAKLQSAVVAMLVRRLHDGLVERGEDMMRTYALAANMTGRAQSRIARLDELSLCAENIQDGTEKQCIMWEWRQKEAGEQGGKVKQALNEAQKRVQDTRLSKLYCDVVALGLGGVADIFKLDVQIQQAERLVQVTSDNIRACEDKIGESESSVELLKKRILQIRDLKKMVSDQKDRLDNVAKNARFIRTKIAEIYIKVLEVSNFLEKLSQKDGDLNANDATKSLSSAIASFEEFFSTNAKLTGLLKDDPGKLQSSFELIAKSEDVEA